MLREVRAATVVEPAADRVVVVAVDRRNLTLLDQRAHLIGVRAVPHQIAAAVQAIDPDRVDRLKARLERRQVAVDVGDDRDAIQRWPPMGRWMSTRFPAGTSVSSSSQTR